MTNIVKIQSLFDDAELRFFVAAGVVCVLVWVCEMYLEDANPVLGVGSDVRGQRVAAL